MLRLIKHISHAFSPQTLLIEIEIICVLLVFLFGIGCTNFKRNDTLLQIGKYKMSVAEYESFRSENQSRFRLTDEQIESKAIEEGYILAYAIENRYDTITLLKRRLFYGNRLYASEVGGYVWNRKVKPLLGVSEEDIKMHIIGEHWNMTSNLFIFLIERYWINTLLLIPR